jgi:hypothetical protein
MAGIDYRPPGYAEPQMPFDAMFGSMYTGVGSIARLTLFFNNKHPGDWEGELGKFAPTYTRPTCSFFQADSTSYHGWQPSPNENEQYYPIVLQNSVTITNNTATDWPTVTGYGFLRDNWNPTAISESQRNITLAKNLIMYRPMPAAEQHPLQVGETFTLMGYNSPVPSAPYSEAFFIRLKIEATV